MNGTFFSIEIPSRVRIRYIIMVTLDIPQFDSNFWPAPSGYYLLEGACPLRSPFLLLLPILAIWEWSFIFIHPSIVNTLLFIAFLAGVSTCNNFLECYRGYDVLYIVVKKANAKYYKCVNDVLLGQMLKDISWGFFMHN